MKRAGRESRKGSPFLFAIFIVAALAIGGGTSPVVAQQPTTDVEWHVEPGIGFAYFSRYPADDDGTSQTGFSTSIRFSRADEWGGLELGYIHVPQKPTTSSSAPRLHVIQAAFVATAEPDFSDSIELSGLLGAARLTIDTQPIDCGGYPVCSEWAPRDGTLWAGVLGGEISGAVFGPVHMFGNLRYYRTNGSWTPLEERADTYQTALGARVRL